MNIVNFMKDKKIEKQKGLKKFKNQKNIFLKYYYKFIKFLKWSWEDNSFLSYISFLFLVFIFLKLIFFPIIGFALNTNYPIVAIVSGSMEHKAVNPCYQMDFFGNCIVENQNVYQICSMVFEEEKEVNSENFWNFCGNYYEKEYNLTKEEFNEFPYESGLNIGDVMILYGQKPKKIEVGDVIVFKPEDDNFYKKRGPVIHRVVKKTQEGEKLYFTTKGDHNSKSQENFETKIPEENIIGKAVFRIPYLGLAKIYLTRLIGFFI